MLAAVYARPVTNKCSISSMKNRVVPIIKILWKGKFSHSLAGMTRQYADQTITFVSAFLKGVVVIPEHLAAAKPTVGLHATLLFPLHFHRLRLSRKGEFGSLAAFLNFLSWAYDRLQYESPLGEFGRTFAPF